ncbi:MAG: M56 family metallopeptidase [Pseudomonadota bacterium]
MIITYLSVALLIGLVLLVRRPFARAFGAKAAYALWALPLARLVMPPIPNWMSPLSWFAAKAAPAPTSLPAQIPSIEGTAPPPSLKSDMLTSIPEPGAGLAPSTIVEAAPGPMAQPVMDAAPVALALPSIDQIITAIILLSITGAAVLVVRQLFAQWQFSRLIRNDSKPPSERLDVIAQDVQAIVGLTRNVPVRTSFLCGAPLVTGLLRPVILVPAWFEQDYTEDEQRIALTHEAMHVKRGDLLALQAAHFVAAIQWLNPLAWNALDAFRADQEAACDADVLALKTTTPHSYGATLLKAIRLSRPGGAPAFAAALPLNHSIKERFAMLQSESPTPPKKRLALALSLSVGAVALLTTATAQEAELKGGADTTETSFTRVFVTSDPSRSGRELVFLSNPMADVETELDKIQEIEWPEPPAPPTPPTPPEPPMMDLSFLETLGDLEGLEALTGIVTMAVDGSSLSFHGGKAVIVSGEGDKLSFVLDEEEIEALVEQIEVRADVFEEQIERWAEDFEANFETSFEIDIAAFEAEVEKVSAHVESITDSPEFEALVERSAQSIRDLHEACDDEDMRDVDVAIVTSRAGDKAICIDEKADREAVEAAILADPNLTEAEKERFLASGGTQVHIHVSQRRHSHAFSHGDGAQSKDETDD